MPIQAGDHVSIINQNNYSPHLRYRENDFTVTKVIETPGGFLYVLDSHVALLHEYQVQKIEPIQEDYSI